MNPWPVVIQGDDGIRPAGRPDECFYCGSRIGQRHGADCVTISKLVKYEVRARGSVVGVYVTGEPYSWTVHDGMFHKNESSWCVNNALDAIEWNETPDAIAFRAYTDGAPDDTCFCSEMAFEFVEIVDDGPLQDPPRVVGSTVNLP